jgi:hypothetical protein
VEVITVLFKLTGLSDEKARFQVISLLTGSGFTTKESELITQHPSRRRLAQILMIIGYIGFVAGISLLVDIIKKTLSFQNVTILIIFSALILMFFKNKYLLSHLDNIIEKFILKKPFKTKNPSKMYKLITRAKGYGIFNILIDDNSQLIGIALKNSNLKPHNIIILNIDKGNQFIGFPTRDYVIEKGDNLLLYGKVEEVIRAFNIDSKLKK